MIDNRDGKLKTAQSMDRLKELIPAGDRGPSFEENEIVVCKRHKFRITEITDAYGGAITMVPVGPARPIERAGRPKRKAGK